MKLNHKVRFIENGLIHYCAVLRACLTGTSAIYRGLTIQPAAHQSGMWHKTEARAFERLTYEPAVTSWINHRQADFILPVQDRFDWSTMDLRDDEKPLISYGPCQFPTLGLVVQRAWYVSFLAAHARLMFCAQTPGSHHECLGMDSVWFHSS